jgi:hypothetical protein
MIVSIKENYCCQFYNYYISIIKKRCAEITSLVLQLLQKLFPCLWPAPSKPLPERIKATERIKDILNQYAPPYNNLSEKKTKMNALNQQIKLKVLEVAEKTNQFKEIVRKHPDDQELRRKFFGPVWWGEDVDAYSLTMAGIALAIAPQVTAVIATQDEQQEAKNCFVCETLTDFKNKFNNILDSLTPSRTAFIISSCFFNNDMGVFPWQHKITIGVEKKEDSIKIIIFDSQSRTTNTMGLRTSFIYDNFLQSRKLKSTIYIPNIDRETSFGCGTYAMKDALLFLKEEKDFFNQISEQPAENKGTPNIVWTPLPPQYMIGTQSIKKIKAYSEKNPQLATKEFSLNEKTQTLEQHLADYTIKNDSSTFSQNHYITFEFNEYLNNVLNSLETSTAEEISTSIKNIWVGHNLAKAPWLDKYYNRYYNPNVPS